MDKNYRVGKVVPTLVGLGYVQIASSGSHVLGIKSDGNLYSWGNNYAGQVGDGTNIQRNSPVLITSNCALASAGWH